MKVLWALAAASAFVFATPARAEDKVKFFVDVVYATDKGTEVDPPSLQEMKADFTKTGATLTSFKRVSNQTVELTGKGAAMISLPNGTKAEFKLKSIEKDVARIAVVVGALHPEIQLGKKGAVSVYAGKHQDGVLILSVAPITDDKKRREETK